MRNDECLGLTADEEPILKTKKNFREYVLSIILTPPKIICRKPRSTSLKCD